MVVGPEVVIADEREAGTEKVPDVEAVVAEFIALTNPTDMPSDGIVASEGRPSPETVNWGPTDQLMSFGETGIMDEMISDPPAVIPELGEEEDSGATTV